MEGNGLAEAVAELRERVMRMHEALIRSLQAFCEQRFHISWSADEAATALEASVSDNELLSVKAATEGTVVYEPEHATRGARYIVGAFVQHLQETQSPDFGYLITLVTRNMLANAIFLQDTNVSLRDFKKTHIYFDTTFLPIAKVYDNTGYLAELLVFSTQ